MLNTAIYQPGVLTKTGELSLLSSTRMSRGWGGYHHHHHNNYHHHHHHHYLSDEGLLLAAQLPVSQSEQQEVLSSSLVIQLPTVIIIIIIIISSSSSLSSSSPWPTWGRRLHCRRPWRPPRPARTRAPSPRTAAGPRLGRSRVTWGSAF